MSIHPSLRIGSRGKQHRSVLKRFEKIEILKKRGDWDFGKSVFGLPKVKTVRIKIRKEKVAKETPEAAAVPAAGETAPITAPQPGKEKTAGETKK
jgi:small basic protein (TIGR04137 family)